MGNLWATCTLTRKWVGGSVMDVGWRAVCLAKIPFGYVGQLYDPGGESCAWRPQLSQKETEVHRLQDFVRVNFTAYTRPPRCRRGR